MLTKEEMLQMLHKNVVPAFGCTEPVCVALAAADAAKAVGGTVESVHVLVSGNIYKNGMAVGIPNFNKIGIAYAAALGAYLANPEEELELLKEITPDIAEKATALAEGGQVTVDINKHQQGVYVKCEVRTSAGTGESEIAQSHANIISTKANGETVFEKAAGTKASDPLLEKLRIMKIAEIRALVDSCTEEELAFLLDGIDMNEDAARYSMHTAGVGVGIAATMQSGRRHPRGSAAGTDHAARGVCHGRAPRRLPLCGHEQRRQRQQGHRRDHPRGRGGEGAGELPGNDGEGHRLCTPPE